MAIFPKNPRSTKKTLASKVLTKPPSFKRKWPMGTLARAKSVHIS